MRTHYLLRCLAAVILCQIAQCISIPSSFLVTPDASPSHQQPSQAVGQRQQPRNTPPPFDMSQLTRTESLPSTTETSQTESTDGSTPTRDDPPFGRFTTSSKTVDESSTTDSTSITSTSKPEVKASSAIRTTATSTISVSSASSSTIEPSATTSAIPISKGKSFQMNAASIAATIVLGCFIVGGAAIMLYYRIRRHLELQRQRRWSNLAPDSEHSLRPKSLGDSRVSSAMSARESMMYHPEDRKWGFLSTSRRGDDLNQYVSEQEPHYDYRVENNDILLNAIESNHEPEHSPVSPLMPPNFPRPVSSISRQSESQSLRREFSFENTPEPPPRPPRDSMMNRRSALSSNPPSDWPLAMPSHYGRGFPPRPLQGHRLGPAERSITEGSYSVVRRQSFEDVQTRGA